MHKCRDDLHAPLLLLQPLGTLGRHCSSHCCSGTAWNGWSKRSCLTDAATMMYIVQDEVHGLLMLPTASDPPKWADRQDHARSWIAVVSRRSGLTLATLSMHNLNQLKPAEILFLAACCC